MHANPRPPQWHRTAGRRTKYHLDRPDWVRSGRAVCGADTSAPAYVAGLNHVLPERVRNPKGA